jgi:hypothetical protein
MLVCYNEVLYQYYILLGHQMVLDTIQSRRYSLINSILFVFNSYNQRFRFKAHLPVYAWIPGSMIWLPNKRVTYSGYHVQVSISFCPIEVWPLYTPNANTP